MIEPAEPQLAARFEGLAPGQPLLVGRRVPLLIQIAADTQASTGERAGQFRYSFADGAAPEAFVARVFADPTLWAVTAVEPELIISPPGTVAQEALFLLTAKRPGRDMLYISLEHRASGTSVCHLWLPVSAIQDERGLRERPQPPIARWLNRAFALTTTRRQSAPGVEQHQG
jgi:hypothetical protein